MPRMGGLPHIGSRLGRCLEEVGGVAEHRDTETDFARPEKLQWRFKLHVFPYNYSLASSMNESSVIFQNK